MLPPMLPPEDRVYHPHHAVGIISLVCVLLSLLQASRIFWCNWQAGWRLPHLQKLYVRIGATSPVCGESLNSCTIGVAPTFFSVFAFAQLVDPEGGFEWFTEAASHLFEGYLVQRLPCKTD